MLLRKRFAEDADALAAVITAKAMEGDMQAAKLILDRILPPLKPASPTVEIDLPGPLSPLSAAGAIIQSAANGQLAPDVASQLVGAIAQLCRIAEIEEIRGRLEALERATKERKASGT